jgi:hypothetical protein
MAFDYQGRVLSQLDDFTSSDHTMIASLPVRMALCCKSGNVDRVGYSRAEGK